MKSKYNIEALKQDFYAEVNKEWLKKTRIPQDKSAVGGFSLLDKKIEKNLKKLANEWCKKPALIPNETLENFISFYKVCKNHNYKETLGLTKLVPSLEKILNIQNYDDIQKNYITYEYEGFMLPFAFGITQDFVDNTKQVLAVDHPHLILPEKSYYEDHEKRDLLLNKFKETVVQLGLLAGFEKDVLETIAKDAVAFDALNIEMAKSATEHADYVKSYNVYKLADINVKTTIFDIAEIAKELVKDPDITTIIVDNPRFIEALNTIYNPTTFKLFKARMFAHFLMSNAQYTTEEARSLLFAYSSLINGAKKMISKTKFAYQLATSYFKMPYGIYYAQKFFGHKAKAKVENMVETMINVYKERLQKNTWLSKATIEKAICKLNALEPKIAFPNNYEPYYDQLKTTADNIFDNIQAYSKVITAYHYAQYMQPIKDYWEMSPATVNAYFHPFKNVIVFPAAILDEPFFSLKYSSSRNYGGIGAVIAHEISHAFDNNGSQFDEKGNLNNWWTDQDRIEFDLRAKKVIDMFDQIKTPYGMSNGLLTVSENIADLGGFMCAYEAAKKENDFDAKDFFYGWASVWACKHRSQYAQLLLKSDVHSLAKLRANVQISNFDEFYQVFDAQEDDKMYLAPEKRAVIW
ncbi:hypothetical protein OF375_00250 [Ureaplasma miroungigenitalium]|uniref:M13-type metalloendopeptidase n=1 Tax=Ureaplasma miroungigenitalium TaxID=1042321 RepID=UPI0021E8046A|nr:M13-type metalloendopeptidase [Ureaplasma miroungigenitalium]MCV3734025.1 hypothetical protein [Ureaplasma miroungigenitalium]